LPTLALGCTAETKLRASMLDWQRPQIRPLCADRIRARLARLKEPRFAFLAYAFQEFSRPSGDIRVGIRITRAYHTRHTPFLGFLNPSAVFSPEHVVCLVSCRHHLWDSKNQDGSALLTSRLKRCIRRHSAQAHQAPDGQMTRVTYRHLTSCCCCLVSLRLSRCLRARCRCATHRIPCKQDIQEEDSPTYSNTPSEPHEATLAAANAREMPTSDEH
jgi:hypothetical protein